MLKEESSNGVLVLKVSGRLDAVTTPAIEKRIFELIHLGSKKLLIDCDELEYLSSAGLRMFLAISKKLKTSGKLALCGVTAPVMGILKMAGFDQFLEIETSRESAARHFH